MRVVTAIAIDIISYIIISAYAVSFWAKAFSRSIAGGPFFSQNQ